MGSGRRLELIEAECRRHAALARADAARRAEHEEVAEALAWALRCLGKEEPICVSVRLTPLSPPPSARNRAFLHHSGTAPAW